MRLGLHGRRWRHAVLTVALAGIVTALALRIEGTVVVTTDEAASMAVAWPRWRLDPRDARPGERVTVSVSDISPWAYVALDLNGRFVPLGDGQPGPGTWSWTTSVVLPRETAVDLTFYYNCHAGCVERDRVRIGAATAPAPPRDLVPTKLGVVFAHPDRDWHGRQGWDVELVYCSAESDPRWSIHALAERVRRAALRGLRVLVRVAYDREQSLPPTDDQIGLTRYLACAERVARDSRLRDVYAYFFGSGFNTAAENVKAAGRLTTARWYARVFNGAGLDPGRTDNVVQRMRATNPGVRVLVGPVTPWVSDQGGDIVATLDTPWLNYMNTLVATLAESSAAKAAVGVPGAAPDGFALQAPGRPSAAPNAAREPVLDLRSPDWNGAQMGFRVYRDWLAIINAYPTTSGLPVYITSSNTYAPDVGTPPVQNYPAGWLRTAAEAIDAEPQVHALAWFLDDAGDEAWEFFSLWTARGQLLDAANDFDQLLTRP